jgi:hypothetical protein
MAKSADAVAAGPTDIEMNLLGGALATIDDDLVPTKSKTSHEFANATESCHRKD